MKLNRLLLERYDVPQETIQEFERYYPNGIEIKENDITEIKDQNFISICLYYLENNRVIKDCTIKLVNGSKWIKYIYNEKGYIKEMSHSDGEYLKMLFDEYDNITDIFDAKGVHQKNFFDLNNELISSIEI